MITPGGHRDYRFVESEQLQSDTLLW